jgi:AAA+ ATPase superfamily predicted ATPase
MLGDDAGHWLSVKEKIVLHQRELDDTIKHLTDISLFSKTNLQEQARNLTDRHKPDPDSEELAKFPLAILPFSRNRKFFGRKGEIEKIHEALKWEGNRPLRNYSIYGRRGIGKTEIALEYAHQNPSNFDAIFWIRCETTLTLRQSFTELAISRSKQDVGAC